MVPHPPSLAAALAAGLQFVSLVRMVHWIWLVLALIGITIGGVLLALGDQANPRTVYHQEESSGLATNYRRHYYAREEEIGDQGTYSTLVAIGVIILLAGEHRQSLVVQFFSEHCAPPWIGVFGVSLARLCSPPPPPPLVHMAVLCVPSWCQLGSPPPLVTPKKC